MTTYVHTNLVARDWKRLSAFYQDVFGCRQMGESRDLRGVWLDRLTGIPDVQVVGEHLSLPGYDIGGPTLEIFSYEPQGIWAASSPNTGGYGHLAFAVDDVAGTLHRLHAAGGSQVGELVSQRYPDGRVLTAVYARDPEGNIIEIQHWAYPAARGSPRSVS